MSEARMTVNQMGVVYNARNEIVAFYDRGNNMVEVSSQFVNDDLKGSLWYTNVCYLYNVYDEVELFDKLNQVVNF